MDGPNSQAAPKRSLKRRGDSNGGVDRLRSGGPGHPWVRALEVILVSALLAKIVDLLISRFLLRLTLRAAA